MVGGFRLLRQKRRHSSGYNHPCGYRTDAALHRRVRLLLQVRQIITFSPKRGPPQTRLVLFLFFSVCWCVRFVRTDRRKSQQAEREYEKVKHQLENLEESVRDRCKKEFTGTRSWIKLFRDYCKQSWIKTLILVAEWTIYSPPNQHLEHVTELIYPVLVLQLLAWILICCQVFIVLTSSSVSPTEPSSKLSSPSPTRGFQTAACSVRRAGFSSASRLRLDYVAFLTVYVESRQQDSAARALAQTSETSLQVFLASSADRFQPSLTALLLSLRWWWGVSRLFTCQTFKKRRRENIQTKVQVQVQENPNVCIV